jgi:hypothetical protein
MQEEVTPPAKALLVRNNGRNVRTANEADLLSAACHGQLIAPDTVPDLMLQLYHVNEALCHLL